MREAPLVTTIAGWDTMYIHMICFSNVCRVNTQCNKQQRKINITCTVYVPCADCKVKGIHDVNKPPTASGSRKKRADPSVNEEIDCLQATGDPDSLAWHVLQFEVSFIPISLL